MRLYGRIGYKLITLLLLTGLLVLICANYFGNDAGNALEQQDEFLLHLPTIETPMAMASPVIRQTAASELNQSRSGGSSSISSGGVVEPLMNLTSFSYTMANELCRKMRLGNEMLGIIIVTSYAGHDELRAAHRQAIPQSKLAEMGIQRIFLLGALPEREHFITQAQLENEQQRFGDLLQGNFIEDYRNLSYKHVMGLRWAAEECTRAKFIIKLDDDIVYDVFQLRRYLETLEVKQNALATSDHLLAGFVLENEMPKRNKANKWYVSEQEYADSKYPAFLSGWLYITNPATAKRLANEAQQQPIFWIDDTWVTGVLRARLNITIQSLNPWYSANAEFIDCCVRDLKESNYECEYFVGPNGGDSKLLVELLHNVEKCYFDECGKRPPGKSLKQTCVASAKHIMPEHGLAQVEPVKL